MIRLLFYLFVIAFFTACGGGSGQSTDDTSVFIHPVGEEEAHKNYTGHSVQAFFGDKQNNRVVIVDVNNMKLSDKYEVYTGHEITYTADRVVGVHKVYVVNRGSDAIDVVDTDTHELIKTIDLPHHPRSAEAMNKTYGLCAVSGMDKAMVSIIDIKTDRLLFSVGDSTVTYPVDAHGGSHACGHPFWLDKDHFVLLDRARKKITTYRLVKKGYNKWGAQKLNELTTVSSVHQIIPSKGNYKGEKYIFYATGEGTDRFYPSIIKLVLTKSGLFQLDELFLTLDGVPPSKTHLHHGDFHPFEKTIYVGSSDGTLFVVDYSHGDLRIKKRIRAGKGAGHTVMIPKKNMAIVINHKDKFVTAIDLKTNTKIKDISVSFAPKDIVGKSTIQAHPKYYVSEDGNYMYAFLTQEGVLYKLDLNRLEVEETLWVGGKPAQGSFVFPPKSSPDVSDTSQERIDLASYFPRENISYGIRFFNSKEEREKRGEVTLENGWVVYSDLVGAQIKFQIQNNYVVYRFQNILKDKEDIKLNRYIKPKEIIFNEDTVDTHAKFIFVERLERFQIKGREYRGDILHLRFIIFIFHNASFNFSLVNMDFFLQKYRGIIAMSADLIAPDADDSACLDEKEHGYKQECLQRLHASQYHIF